MRNPAMTAMRVPLPLPLFLVVLSSLVVIGHSLPVVREDASVDPLQLQPRLMQQEVDADAGAGIDAMTSPADWVKSDKAINTYMRVNGILPLLTGGASPATGVPLTVNQMSGADPVWQKTSGLKVRTCKFLKHAELSPIQALFPNIQDSFLNPLRNMDPGNSASDARFYMTTDKKFLLKTMSDHEWVSFQALLTGAGAAYQARLTGAPAGASLLPRYVMAFELHANISPFGSATQRYVVFSNTFQDQAAVEQVGLQYKEFMFDGKGSRGKGKCSGENFHVKRTNGLIGDFMERYRLGDRKGSSIFNGKDDQGQDMDDSVVATQLRDVLKLDLAFISGVDAGGGYLLDYSLLIQTLEFDWVPTAIPVGLSLQGHQVRYYSGGFTCVRAEPTDRECTWKPVVFYFGIIDMLQHFDHVRAAEGDLKAGHLGQKKWAEYSEFFFSMSQIIFFGLEGVDLQLAGAALPGNADLAALVTRSHDIGEWHCPAVDQRHPGSVPNFGRQFKKFLFNFITNNLNPGTDVPLQLDPYQTVGDLALAAGLPKNQLKARKCTSRNNGCTAAYLQLGPLAANTPLFKVQWGFGIDTFLGDTESVEIKSPAAP